MAVCQNLVPLVNIKIAGKWMFIPLKMVLIGIDPYPHVIKYQPGQNRVSSLLPGWETDQCRWEWSLMIYQRRMVTCSLRKWSSFQRFRDIARYIRYMPMIYHFYPLHMIFSIDHLSLYSYIIIYIYIHIPHDSRYVLHLADDTQSRVGL